MAKKLSIRAMFSIYISFAMVLVLTVLVLLVYKNISGINDSQYDKKLRSTLVSTDEALNQYFGNIVTLTKMFGDIELVKEDTDAITTYVDKEDSSGKVPMDVNLFTPYEKQVYELEKTFDKQNLS